MEKLMNIMRAIKFATKTHEVYQKQKRKGKDISYITHPLTVGLILSQAGAGEDLVCAGILHDTIEDSVDQKKVTFEMLEERFGKNVAQLVLAVTETDKSLPWEERKEQAREHIKYFSRDAILLKSADMVSNLTELVDDYEKDKDLVFERFNASKTEIIINAVKTIAVILRGWPENPIASELRFLSGALQMMGAVEFMSQWPATIVQYANYDEGQVIQCPVCYWQGLPKEMMETHDDSMSADCPNCGKMVLIVEFPLVGDKS